MTPRTAAPAAAADPEAEPRHHEPGDHHSYRIVCDVCGQEGTLRVSVDPDRTPATGHGDPEDGE